MSWIATLARYWPHLTVAALLTVAVIKAYDWAYDNGYNASRAEAEKTIREFAQAEADAQRRARESEQTKARLIAEIDRGHNEDKANAKAAADAVTAAVLADNARLRKHWQGAQATARVSGAAASATIADADAQLRAASAGRIIGAGKEADDWIKRLQELAEADRQ